MDDNLKTATVAEAPKPSQEDAVHTPAEIEHATATATPTSAPPQQANVPPTTPAPPQSWLSNHAPILVFAALVVLFIGSVSWLAQHVSRQLPFSAGAIAKKLLSTQNRATRNGAMQAQAESLLERAAAGDSAAADQLLAQSSGWTGKTARTPKTEQAIAAAINANDMHIRAAALQAQLALDGVPVDPQGFDMLKRATGNRQQRTWGLWMMGALGNRGVDPVHAAKIIEAYLSDPDPAVRTSAVEGLAILGTDETVPMLLDRFRNDPSPPVQEQAACGMAEAGMYTHAQRMVAAASLVGWVNDPLLSQPQRNWAVQALHDISGQNFGANADAWRQWYDGNR